MNTFDVVRELTELVSLKNLQTSDFLSNQPGEKRNQLERLYDGIASGEFKNDEEACREIFNSEEKDSSYRSLKTNLLNKLHKFIFIVDFETANQTKYQKAYYECHKNYASVKILIGKGNVRSAIFFAEKLIKEAVRYEFTSISLGVSILLRRHFATVEGDLKMYLKYKAMAEKFQQIKHAEFQAEMLYEELMSHFVISKGPKKSLIQFVNESLNILEPLNEIVESKQFTLHYFQFKYYQIIFRSKYKNAIQFCEKAINYFDGRDNASKAANLVFNYHLIICNIQLGKYEEGLLIIRSTEILVGRGKNNWFKIKELEFLLYIRSEQYEKAANLYFEIVNHVFFKRLYQNVFEEWNIFGAYIELLIRINYLDAKKYNGHSFRISKFINEIQIYQQDKDGLNLSVRMLQFLFLLQAKKYGLIIDKEESLDKYRRRYLKAEELKRSDLIVKMLLLIPKNGFEKEEVRAEGAKFLEELKETPMILNDQSFELEAIPYETIWEMALGMI